MELTYNNITDPELSAATAVCTETKAACVKVKGRHNKPVWVVSELIHPTHLSDNPDYVLCYPRYCSIHYKDVETVRGERQYGKMNSRETKLDRALGMEFSGYDYNGKRVMGSVQEQV